MTSLRGLLGAIAILQTTSLWAQDFANVEYLCCDWGPAMTLPGKTNEPPRFSDTEEDVYFLKQVTRFTRQKLEGRDLLTGQPYRDIGSGVGIYLCKMKPDGTEKAEVRELWRNPSHPIDTQAQTTWMDVNEQTKKIVISIVIGGAELTGLWTMNLDGSDLKRIQVPGMENGGWSGFVHPSWMPDGKCIVFGKTIQGTNGLNGGIARCDVFGSNTVYLLHDQFGSEYDISMPRVSPTGTGIVYLVKSIDASQRGVWMMSANGGERRRLPNNDDKQKGYHSGLYPAWSPDGKRIILSGNTVVDVTTGQTVTNTRPVYDGKPFTAGWCHWGKAGIVGFTVAGIFITDPASREVKALGLSKLTEISSDNAQVQW
jgi:hypothetical protein